MSLGFEIVSARERDLDLRRAGMAEGARLATAGLLEPRPLLRMCERPEGFVEAVVCA